METAAPETANGWVYRADEVEPLPAPESEGAKEDSSVNPVLLAGMGMFFLGAGAITAASLAALGVFFAPLHYARSVWNR